MKKALFLLLTFCIGSLGVYAQEVAESSIVDLYMFTLNQNMYRIHSKHPMDKKEYLVLVDVDMDMEQVVQNKNLKWVYGNFDLFERLKGNKAKHNGRTVLSLTHKIISSDTVNVRFEQYVLEDLPKLDFKLALATEKHTTTPLKKNDFPYILKDNKWVPQKP